MRFTILTISLISIILMLTGCGGGGGGGTTPTVNTGTVVVTVDWAERGRDVTGPSSALSVVLRIPNGAPGGGDAVISVDRPAGSAAVPNQTYTIGPIVTGQRTVNVEFHAQVSGTGAIVATASKIVTVAEGANDAGAFTNYQTVIASVEVGAGQSFVVGEIKELVYTARNSQGTAVALTPGSVIWTVISGAENLQIVLSGTNKGKAQGLNAGSSTVRAAVDGVSGEGTVSVTGQSALIHYQIIWAERSRAVNAPSSALSAVVTVVDASPSGGDVTETINRSSDTAGYTSDMNIGPTLIGSQTIRIQFYAQEDGQGDLVGTAEKQLALTYGLNEAGAFTNNQTIITSIEVGAEQTLVTGEIKELVCTAKNSQGATVAVSLGSVFWTVLTGTDKLQILTSGVNLGKAQGIADGFATVRATIDGVSGEGTITITGQAAMIHYQITWAERSRAANAPSSALSAVVTIPGASPSGGDVSASINRNAETASYTSDLNIGPMVTGTQTFRIRFYAEANGQGDIVGSTEKQLTLTDGVNEAGVFSVSLSIASVEVTANQMLGVGEIKQLTCVARNGAGQTVSISDGSIYWNVASGGTYLRFLTSGVNNGKAEGLLLGTASVTATIDGIVSPAVNVTIGAASGTFQINWGARTRSPLTSALSARCVVTGGKADGTDAVLIAERPASPTANTSDHNLTEMRVGTFSATVTFYAGQNATGAAIGSITRNITLQYGANSIGLFDPVSTIASVAVDGGQVVYVGQRVKLSFTARNALNEILPISWASGAWSVVSGGAVITFETSGEYKGYARGLIVGMPTVRVTVDGVASAATPVQVKASYSLYAIIDLGTLPGTEQSTPFAINDAGEVVGYSDSDLWQRYGFLWDGTMTNLGDLGSPFTEALDINETPYIVGTGETGDLIGSLSITAPFIRNSATLTQLSRSSGVIASATGIDDNGTVVGYVQDENGLFTAVKWQNGSRTELGSHGAGLGSKAMAINNNSQIVGYGENADGMNIAFQWNNGTFSALPLVTNTNEGFAVAINDYGKAVGYCKDELYSYAAEWNSGVVSALTGLGGSESEAYSANNSGQIVGWAMKVVDDEEQQRAVVWNSGTPTDLNTLLSGGAGWLLQSANAINNKGQIIGVGEYNGEWKAYLLTPSTGLLGPAYTDPSDIPLSRYFGVKRKFGKLGIRR